MSNLNSEERRTPYFFPVTKMRIGESIFLVRGKDNQRPAWHYILVYRNLILNLRALKPQSNINVIDYGRFVRYIDANGSIRQASGWGVDPPKELTDFLDEYYGEKMLSLISKSSRSNDPICFRNPLYW